MIHKIKALYDEGRGSSIREIARALRISRNTVRKYLALDAEAISVQRADPGRAKSLDAYREYLIHLLETFPRLSAVKVRRKLEEKMGPLPVSSRSLRRYISALKEEVVPAQRRYYEPVLDSIPGVQCQVDPGELRDVLIDGVATTVYFVVFVLSYSRLMYVGTSHRPIDTETFIRLHDAAFRAFGGRPEECVYDQTRLVVLDEQYRELTLNPRFAQYATAAGFRIRACEGYDPESKGKVEAGVKYVKNDALYGEQFAHWADLEQHLHRWLEEVANRRTHGTTGQVPQVHYDTGERARMGPYLSPACLAATGIPGEPRKVDKTGLISYQSNKYSVPMAFQAGRVNVLATPDGQLHIYAQPSGELIARHTLNPGKGALVKNGDHYRDKARQIADLEADIEQALGNPLGRRVCHQLRQSEPQHYKDQLRGVRRHLERLRALPETLLAELAGRTGLRVSTVLAYLGAWEANPERFAERTRVTPPGSAAGANLSPYADLTRPTRQETTHGLH